MNILAELRARFEAALEPLTPDAHKYAQMVRPAQDRKFGDFQANCAMPLAKSRQENPRDIAAKVIAGVDVSDLCEQPKIAGPGFINLTLKDDWLVEQTNRQIADERLGVSRAESPKTIVIDYSAPNVAKPMHVGHLRSSVIGASLCRILEYLGHTVIGDNHIGDWGTQFGMIIFGYKTFLDADAFDVDAVKELARLYKTVNQLSDYHSLRAELPALRERLSERQSQWDAASAAVAADDKQAKKAIKAGRSELEKLKELMATNEAKIRAVDDDPRLSALAKAHPNIAAASRGETAKLHAGDAENRDLWERFLPECLSALQQVYDRLAIDFDLSLGESFYQPMLADVVSELQEAGIARVSEDAVCVFLEGNSAPLIIRKADSAFTYATTDLATIKYRVEQLNADLILYVVDARQSEHFRLLFTTAALWGLKNVECRHVAFGTVMGDDRRPFRTRSGDTVGLEGLLDTAITRARAIVDETDDAKTDRDDQPAPELDETTRADVAEAVGIGGVKYADLHHNRESDYVFSWEKMLAKNGDTATYIQYSYARINGIFRRGGLGRSELRNSAARILLTGPHERSLSLQLGRFSDALEEAARELRPNILTQYLFETAKAYSTFFENCPVLKEPDESIRQSRLLLCDLTARVLDTGLSLLGIRTCEQM